MDREERILLIVEFAIAQLQAGHEIDIDAIVDENLDLAPDLSQRLHLLVGLFKTSRGSQTAETDIELFSPLSIQAAHRLHCPNCGVGIQLVETHQELVTCESCGSSFQFAGPETPTRTNDTSGSRFGRFEIVEELGRGAFGVVYKARDSELNRLVAIKCPRAGFFSSRQEEQRFVREAKFAAALDHPNIVPVYEVAQDNGVPYIVSKFIDGLTISEILEYRQFEFREVAAIMAKVSRAVHHAHQHKILHRDLKNSNVLIDHDFEPFVTDFGLARNAEPEFTLTIDGQILGTLHYMSPEQASGVQSEVSYASDIYSLGVMLYRILCKEYPFRGTQRLILYQIREEDPRAPRKLNHVIPKDLETIIQKAMQKEPARRFLTAGRLADELERFVEGKPIKTRPITSTERIVRWCRRNPRVAGLASACLGLLVLATIGSVVWGVQQSYMQAKVSKALLDEEAERRRANASEVAKKKQLARHFLTTGVNQMTRGDNLAALPWLISAWEIEESDPAKDEIHRLRLGTLFRHSPRLVSFQARDVRAMDAEISSDGKLAICGYQDGHLVVWNVQSGETIFSDSFDSSISQVSFDDLNEHFVIGTQGGDVRVYSVHDPSVIFTKKMVTGIKQIDFVAGTDEIIVLPRKSNVIYLFDFEKQNQLEEFHHSGEVRWFKQIEDQNLVAYSLRRGASYEWHLTEWSIRDGTESTSELQCNEAVLSVCQNQKSRRLLICYKSAIEIRDSKNWEKLLTKLEFDSELKLAEFLPNSDQFLTLDLTGAFSSFEGDKRVADTTFTDIRVKSASLSHSGVRLGIGGRGKQAQIWSIESRKAISVPLPHLNMVDGVSFCSDENRVLTFGHDGFAKIWDLSTPDDQSAVSLNHQVVSMDYHPDENQLAVATPKMVRILELPSLQAIGDSIESPSNILDVAYFPSGQQIAVSSIDQHVRIWKLGSREMVRDLPSDVDEFYPQEIQFAGNGKFLILSYFHRINQTGRIRVYRLPDYEVVLEIEAADGERFGFLSVSPDKQMIGIPQGGGTSQVWNLETLKPVSPKLKQHPDWRVMTCEFNEEGNQVITASQDRDAFVWVIETGEKIAGPINHRSSVWDARFGPHANTFLTTSHDGQIHVWDQKGNEIKPRYMLSTFGTISSRVPFANDKRFFFSFSNSPANSTTDRRFSGAAQVWEFETGDSVTPLLGLAKPISKTLFIDNQGVATAGTDGSLKFWQLEPTKMTIETARDLAEVYSGFKIDPIFGSVPLTAEASNQRWERIENDGTEDSGFNQPSQ